LVGVAASVFTTLALPDMNPWRRMALGIFLGVFGWSIAALAAFLVGGP